MPDEGWVPISNAAVRDHRLSWRARGLLAELLSYPDGWETSVDKLVAMARRNGEASEGRAAMRKAIGELADAGYVAYTRTQDKHGHWATEMVVSDEPNPDGANRRTRNRTVGVPTPRLPDTSETETSVDWSVTNKTYTNTVMKTDLQTTVDEHSSTLTSFASRADARSQFLNDTPTMEDVWGLVDRMPEDNRKQALLNLERHRARIYRTARRSAIDQFKRESPGIFRQGQSFGRVDELSLKYAVQHYYPAIPTWLADPIGAPASVRV